MNLHMIKEPYDRRRIVGRGFPCPDCHGEEQPSSHHSCFRRFDHVDITPCYCECDVCYMGVPNREITHVHYCEPDSISLICRQCRDNHHPTPGGHA